jgi:hypothetical protein
VRTRCARIAAAAVAVVLGWATVLWGLIGERTGTGSLDDYDYLVKGPDVARTAQLGIAAVGLVATVAGVAEFIRRARPNVPGRQVAVNLVAPLALGTLLGVGARIVTAATIGANIGGALFLYAGPIPALLLAGLVVRGVIAVCRAHERLPTVAAD